MCFICVIKKFNCGVFRKSKRLKKNLFLVKNFEYIFWLIYDEMLYGVR